MRLFLLLLALLVLPTQARAQDLADLKTLMEETGLKSRTLETVEASWVVPFESSTGKEFDVYVTYANDRRDFALIFTTVVDGEDGEVFGQPLLSQALKLSNDYTGVKFAYDQKYGDLDCQAEVYLGAGAVTAAELKRYINAVADVADTCRADLNALK